MPDPPKAPTPPPPPPPRDPTPPPPPPPEPVPEPELEPPRDPTPPPGRTSQPAIAPDSPPKPEPKSPVKMVTPKPPPIKKTTPPPAPPPLALGALGRKKPAKKDPPKPVRAPKPVPPPPAPATPKSPPPKPATPVLPSVPVTPHTPRVEDQVVWSMLRRRPIVGANHTAVKPTEYHMDMRRRASGETSVSGDSPGDELQHKLHRVMSLSWFPGLGGRGVTVDNVVSVLGECVRSGASARARVEATKMLAYVHTVFQRDIREPATMLLAPQLEALANDPDWHVRAQIAAALPRFGYYHQDVVMGLVARLGDVHPAVRQAAMQSLAFYHIESRDQLETVMIRLGLLSAPSGETGGSRAAGGKGGGGGGGKYRSILDDLYDQYVRREQEKVAKSVAAVQQWLTGAQYRYTKRLSSVGGGVVEGEVGEYESGAESRL
ncbi:hypothetical protein AMAG_09585 [Allomyces macrogynus ATCC 38327]|uniref:TOG domain-containing protein n=1 Tax=Allomyces macrogynus (strain ATCC 38327) TaxID=578462 RepID=A0A0L0STF6_ALLM3|nr:hypothetical protein AMAG_09585 [Allomyces macrogynus ATCC 38327]|eukprot:KNE65604.1 hypothetical protein AMAG_09585 [Allomyces macrogynus ATCC 38327]